VTTQREAPASIEIVPVPELLLKPLLDAAGRTLTRLDAGDIPTVLRQVAGFDPKHLTTSGAARQQLRRAIDVDEAFRERVVERFLQKAEVVAALATWSAEDALQRVEEAAERSDLPLLASVLYAARPDGWAFGLGAVCALSDRQRTEKEHDDDVKAAELRVSSFDEARRRAEEARDAARSEAERLEEQLRDERRSRREREERSAEEAEEADRRRVDAEAVAERARASVDAAVARLTRETERARVAEQSVRELRRELDDRAADALAPQPVPLTRDEVEMLAAAADEARHLTAALDGLTVRAREVAPVEPETVLLVDAEPVDPAVVPPTDSSAPPTPEPELPRRTRALCPPGMRTDTPEALDAMLRTRGVVLIVDGYNVSMAGWGDATPLDQRERLIGALERLHLRVRCDVVVVFDGADVEGVIPSRRTGVRVLFSADGEEADPVVVREVEARPRRVPVVVVSSDQWVHEHAEAQGATVVPSAVLLDVIRR
jgi:predicted RNA-binding protein with PIN domain